MSAFLELLPYSTTVAGRLVMTAALIVLALPVPAVGTPRMARRHKPLVSPVVKGPARVLVDMVVTAGQA